MNSASEAHELLLKKMNDNALGENECQPFPACVLILASSKFLDGALESKYK